jgi:hypothetical protein
VGGGGGGGGGVVHNFEESFLLIYSKDQYHQRYPYQK